jgi:hypothetical protein
MLILGAGPGTGAWLLSICALVANAALRIIIDNIIFFITKFFLFEI